MREYFILSLPWTRENYATWWCPNNSGYTSTLALAGRYTEHDVTSRASYYNNGETTIAIPCDEAEAAAVPVVFDHAIRTLVQRRMQAVVDTEPACELCGHERSWNRGLRVIGEASA